MRAQESRGCVDEDDSRVCALEDLRHFSFRVVELDEHRLQLHVGGNRSGLLRFDKEYRGEVRVVLVLRVESDCEEKQGRNDSRHCERENRYRSERLPKHHSKPGELRKDTQRRALIEEEKSRK